MRAASVVRYLQFEQSIDPERVIMHPIKFA